jgi:hypothetical protein
MGRWKLFGVRIVYFQYDHDPRYVHVYEDGKKEVRFNVESWEVMEGKLSSNARKALETLKEELECVIQNSKL